MKKKDILSVCLMISILGSISVGCSSISNDDTNDLDLGTSNTYDTSITTTLEDTQTSERGTISLATVAMATNPVTETTTNTTTLTTTSITTPSTTTSQVTTIPVKTTTQGTTSEENTLPIAFDLVAMTKDKNALPPLNDQLKNLFEKAFTSYYEFTCGGSIKIDAFDTITLNDKTYSRVIDNRFSSVDEAARYLSQYFTQDFIYYNSYILANFTDYNGQLYTSLGAKGLDMEYCGHTFEIINQTDTEIEFKADIYYSTETWNENYYFINETPTVDYTTEVSRYILIKTDDGWRFDTFSRIY